MPEGINSNIPIQSIQSQPQAARAGKTEGSAEGRAISSTPPKSQAPHVLKSMAMLFFAVAAAIVTGNANNPLSSHLFAKLKTPRQEEPPAQPSRNDAPPLPPRTAAASAKSEAPPLPPRTAAASAKSETPPPLPPRNEPAAPPPLPPRNSPVAEESMSLPLDDAPPPPSSAEEPMEEMDIDSTGALKEPVVDDLASQLKGVKLRSVEKQESRPASPTLSDSLMKSEALRRAAEAGAGGEESVSEYSDEEWDAGASDVRVELPVAKPQVQVAHQADSIAEPLIMQPPAGDDKPVDMAAMMRARRGAMGLE